MLVNVRNLLDYIYRALNIAYIHSLTCLVYHCTTYGTNQSFCPYFFFCLQYYMIIFFIKKAQFQNLILYTHLLHNFPNVSLSRIIEILGPRIVVVKETCSLKKPMAKELKIAYHLRPNKWGLCVVALVSGFFSIKMFML